MNQNRDLSKDLEAKIGALKEKVAGNRALRLTGEITEIQEIEGNRKAIEEAMCDLQSIREDLQVGAACVFIRKAVDKKHGSLQLVN